jgi:hypothetical protein
MAENNPDWFYSLLTVDDTKAIGQKAIQQERDAGMPEEMVQQEFYCSFELGLVGAYYAEKIAQMRRNGQIGNFKHNPYLRVYTAWDLGFDCTPIIFFQVDGNEVNIIDYYANTGKGMDHYVDVIDRKKAEHGYQYGTFFMPHDSNKREMQSGLTLSDAIRQKGFEVEPMEKEINVDVGINRTLVMLHHTNIDEKACEHLIIALMNYCQEYNDTLKRYMGMPRHDWASHPADALRYVSKAVNTHRFNAGASMGLEQYRQMKAEYGY